MVLSKYAVCHLLHARYHVVLSKCTICSTLSCDHKMIMKFDTFGQFHKHLMHVTDGLIKIRCMSSVAHMLPCCAFKMQFVMAISYDYKMIMKLKPVVNFINISRT
jgi:hypothetical protein